MNTTTNNSTTTGHLPIERLSHFDPEVHQRVQQWLASGQLLAWIPILSQENFPDVPPQILQFADQYQEAMRWPIHRPEDLLALPDGITGWLLPADDEDTDVACGVNAGIDTVFVLSGEGTMADIDTYQIHPTWVYPDIGTLYRKLEETI